MKIMRVRESFWLDVSTILGVIEEEGLISMKVMGVRESV